MADVCDNLTLTENRLIGHKQQAENAESITDLQQYQQEHQVCHNFTWFALQKNILCFIHQLKKRSVSSQGSPKRRVDKRQCLK